MNRNIRDLLQAVCTPSAVGQLVRLMNIPGSLGQGDAAAVTRAELAQALNMALFADLLARVPSARAYADDVLAADAPEEIAQYFLSEFHPERFSATLQSTVTKVIGTSIDPLTPQALAWLNELERDGSLPGESAKALLSVLVGCFARQHARPHLADYEALLAESAEMAWITTEGNAFNHATDRVDDVYAVADAQRALGRPIKESVEVSKSGRVKQTAFRADPVQREFIAADGSTVTRTVPGSFYEFITRDLHPHVAAGQPGIDLGFDAGNATGIFKMTAAA